jgi:hypothetical protein
MAFTKVNPSSVLHPSLSELQPHWTVRAARRHRVYHTLHVFNDGRMAEPFGNGGKHWRTHPMLRSMYVAI